MYLFVLLPVGVLPNGATIFIPIQLFHVLIIYVVLRLTKYANLLLYFGVISRSMVEHTSVVFAQEMQEQNSNDIF